MKHNKSLNSNKVYVPLPEIKLPVTTNNIATESKKIHLTLENLSDYLQLFFKAKVNLDLEKFNVPIIIKHYNNNYQITLDTEELYKNNLLDYLYIIDMINSYFDYGILKFNITFETNILFNKIFKGYDLYTINKDGSIDIIFNY